MRPSLTAILLVATLALFQLPDAHAARGDLPTVASSARRCERITRRLQTQERRTLARGPARSPEGCTQRQRRRWARLAADLRRRLRGAEPGAGAGLAQQLPHPATPGAAGGAARVLARLQPRSSTPTCRSASSSTSRASGRSRSTSSPIPLGGLYAHRAGLAVIGENPDSGIPGAVAARVQGASPPGHRLRDHLPDLRRLPRSR